MTSYREAGVDLEGAAHHVTRIGPSVISTWGDSVVGGFGGFAAGVAIPAGYDNPVLMMTTDGVGTKLELARATGRWENVGHDLVAMCVDDLAAVGARPIGFVDYLAVGALDSERDGTIVESIAAACIIAGCPLLGGETAEHPGVMPDDAADLAGAAMGVVERGEEWGPQRVQPGQVVVGLRSPNVRSNGFSLVRSVMGEAITRHAEELLAPSVIYSPDVLGTAGTGAVAAAAHITGGGIVENVARALPDGLGVVVDTGAWEPPSCYSLISSYGVDREEMFSTFNMGIGFALIVDTAGTSSVLAAVGDHDPVVIGEVRSRPGVVLE
jgi:phosphoribosylformylglycinamidine cyclo-ligase